MAIINTTVLLALADSGVDAQLASLGVQSMSADLQAVMAAETAKRKTANLTAAATVILDLSAQADQVLVNNVTSINALNDQIEAINKVNAGIVLARQYGSATDNFLPLAAAIGAGLPTGIKAELKKVPADWAPAAPVAA